jgi:H+/gluconate symporter-like permease
MPVVHVWRRVGLLIELCGYSEAIVHAAARYIGGLRANAVIVAVCALLRYGRVFGL